MAAMDAARVSRIFFLPRTIFCVCTRCCCAVSRKPQFDPLTDRSYSCYLVSYILGTVVLELVGGVFAQDAVRSST